MPPNHDIYSASAQYMGEAAHFESIWEYNTLSDCEDTPSYSSDHSRPATPTSMRGSTPASSVYSLENRDQSFNYKQIFDAWIDGHLGAQEDSLGSANTSVESPPESDAGHVDADWETAALVVYAMLQVEFHKLPGAQEAAAFNSAIFSGDMQSWFYNHLLDLSTAGR